MDGILGMFQTGDAWGTLTIVCYVVSLLFLIISIILAVMWNLNALWDELSGKRQKREIANYDAASTKNARYAVTDTLQSNTDSLVQTMWANKDAREMNINNRNLDLTISDAQAMADQNREFVTETRSDPNYYEDYYPDDSYVPEDTGNIGRPLQNGEMLHNIQSYVQPRQTGGLYSPKRMSQTMSMYNAPTGYIDETEEQAQSSAYEQPTSYLDNSTYEQPTSYLDNSTYEQPTGYLEDETLPAQTDYGYEQPTNYLDNSTYEQPTGYLEEEHKTDIELNEIKASDFEQPTGYLDENGQEDYEQPTGYLDNSTDQLDYRNTYMGISGQLKVQKETNMNLLRDIVAADTSGSAYKTLEKCVTVLSNNGENIAPYILMAGGSEEDDYINNLAEM